MLMDYKTKKYGKGKYIFDIVERPDFVMVDFYIPNDSRIYLRGYMQSDNSVSFIAFENYKPNNARLEHVLVKLIL